MSFCCWEPLVPGLSGVFPFSMSAVLGHAWDGLYLRLLPITRRTPPSGFCRVIYLSRPSPPAPVPPDCHLGARTLTRHLVDTELTRTPTPLRRPGHLWAHSPPRRGSGYSVSVVRRVFQKALECVLNLHEATLGEKSPFKRRQAKRVFRLSQSLTMCPCTVSLGT